MNVFIVHVPFHYYLFRSIYKNLEDSAFIVPPMSDKPMYEKYGSGMSGSGLWNYMCSFLKSKRVNIADYGNIKTNNFIKFINESQFNLVCPHYFDGLYDVQEKRIFKFAYAVPNEGSPQFDYKQNCLVDVVFTYGNESAKRFEKRDLKSVVVGNPLFDDWFNDRIDEVSLELIRGKLLKDAPTIVYLPTHGYYSSIDQFGDTIIELGRDYNVIVKLHHMTFNGEANRLCRFISHPEIVTLGDFFDPLVLYKIADIVLTDASGALFDAMMVEKPVIMLSNSLLKYSVDVLTTNNQGAAVEESGLFPYTENPEELEEVIKKTLSKQSSINDKILYELFYKRDGLASKRTADIMVNEVEYPLIPTLEKYDRAIERAAGQKDRQEINELKNRYIRSNYPKQSKKQGILSRISYHFFRN